MAERSGTIEVDGRRLGWRSVGDGPPLVLLNGYAATTADWDPTFLSALGASFEVLCPDHRGMGESEPGDLGALSIDAMADDVGALLDARGIAAAPVAGWSMGGFVAQRLAARAPERVSHLMLLSTDPGGAEAVLAEPATWAALCSHAGTPREQATRLLGLLFPPGLAEAIDAQFGELVAGARATLSPAVLSAQERAIDAWHASAPAGAPPAPVPPPAGSPAGAPPASFAPPAGSPAAPPVLVAHGDQDVVIPPANADALAVRWPGARVERFAGGGHAFMAQEPTRLAEQLAGFARG
jgi:3-oxoadipate enol-lactonase